MFRHTLFTAERAGTERARPRPCSGIRAARIPLRRRSDAGGRRAKRAHTGAIDSITDLVSAAHPL
ncbi:hypothetical protein GCM10010094_54120 [Streptomyces flaveus]|uniref:Uncharacterized protein n=1 Tax=Streptomyces flaveus TaxID=66370 RepID=A0A917R2A9_9ACTN|nr:hypothetical protein GCM10010094_54120 [Streptomyces flaveus]